MGPAERQRELVRAERADLASFLATLAVSDWTRPTWCEGWTVRDVVAHLVAWDDVFVHRSLTTRALALSRWTRLMVAARLRADRIDGFLVAPDPALPPAELVARFVEQGSGSPRWLFDGIAPGTQLAEYVVHHEDVRHAVSAPRHIPPDRLRQALDGLARLPAVGAKERLARARWVATDLDWSGGRGPAERRLPAHQLLLALSGRSATA